MILKAKKEVKVNCGCFLIIAAISLFLCAECTEWALWVWFGKDVPWYFDYLIGFILSEVMPIIFVITLIASLIAQTPIF